MNRYFDNNKKWNSYIWRCGRSQIVNKNNEWSPFSHFLFFFFLSSEIQVTEWNWKKEEQNKNVLSERQRKKERRSASARCLIRLRDPLMVGAGEGRGGRRTTMTYGRFLDPVMVGAGEGRMTTWAFSRPGDGEREGRNVVGIARSKDEKRLML